MSQYWEQRVESAEDMIALGGRLAANLHSIQRIYFSGDLGAGKTILIRGILQGLGHQGPVKSPTFSLLEPYTDKIRPVFHFDFYRIESAWIETNKSTPAFLAIWVRRRKEIK